MVSEFVHNELLAYAFDSFDRDTTNDLEDVLVNFYGDGAVHDAKTLIWQKYKEQLPKCQERRNTTAKMREVSDIMLAVKTIDQKYSSDDVIPFVFVAIKMKNIPNERYVAEMSIRNRLLLLETQMSEVLAAKSSYATTAASDAMHPAMSVHTKPKLRNVPGQPIPMIDHNSHTPGLYNQRQTAVTRQLPPSADVVTGAERNPDEATPFQMVKNRRKTNRQTAVYGSGKDDIVTAGLQKHELFVFQINKTVTADQVEGYIAKKDVTVASIKLMSSDESPSNSYHVTVLCLDIRPMLTPEFWPNGVGCRRFRSKKQQWANR